MLEIDRFILLIRPSELFFNFLSTKGLEEHLDEELEDCLAILIPTFEDDASLNQWLRANYAYFLEGQLNLLDLDPHLLEDEIHSFDEFILYFALEIHTIVYDSVSRHYTHPNTSGTLQ